MKTNKNVSKIKLNKSDYPKSKSKSKIKVSLSQNKSSYNINQYVKTKNDLILSYERNKTEESPYKMKIDEKEKLIESYKTKLEKEKLINKNLWHELNEYKLAINKNRESYKKLINQKQTKSEELIVITNKLTKLIEMVINFSYSMAYLRSNIYSKNKRRFNESTLAYESLNNNLKQIYNEFEQINKNLKNIKDINIKVKRSSKSSNKSEKNIKTEINDAEKRNNQEKIDISKNHINTTINNKDKLKQDINENKNISNTEINVNSYIKDDISLDKKNDDIHNTYESNNNINSNLFPKVSLNKENNSENNIINKEVNYKKINDITPLNERESLKKEENDENDFEKTKKISLNSNSEKIFTFRNNSQISKDGSEKINLGDSQQPIDMNADINKLIEENKNLKMQLASEKLKNNNILNNSQNESHNDEEYEEIISELKLKMEEKDNLINDLKKQLETIPINNNIINEIHNKNENEKICNNINVNVNLPEVEKIKDNYQENIKTIRSIYEKMIIEKENKINELQNEINIIEKDLEELNDKYDQEKENNRINIIKINELENEKISLLTEISNFKALN